MAKVILQLKDRAGGQVSLRLTSHPEAGPDPADFTPAQKMGLALITHLSHLNPLGAKNERANPPASPAPGTPITPSSQQSPKEFTLSMLEGSGV